ncbi:MAG TPA: radical SAM protein [Acidimicrobiales bacterium]|nr:radical SAM protein [Acidimicrobiales bacterium]
MRTSTRTVPLRWRIAEEEEEGRLFGDDEVVERHVGRGEFRRMEFLHVNARSILNRVPEASRVPFRWTINAYRGCSHACTYCFARPTHEYLGLGIGEDFERRIVVKVNAVERLRHELSSSRWLGEHVAMGTNTDPYQPAEGKYHLTRGVIEVLGERENPFSILTKSTLVLRDLAVLAQAARRTDVRVNLSVGTLDRGVWKMSEPGTPPPERRLEAVRRLNEAGIPCGVLVAPVLPGLSDAPGQLEQIGAAAAEAGAVSVTPIALHLRRGVRDHYLAWLSSVRPDLVPLYEGRFRRAYQPEDEQRRIAETVHRAFRRAGGSAAAHGDTSWRQDAAWRADESSTRESPPGAEQLRFSC